MNNPEQAYDMAHIEYLAVVWQILLLRKYPGIYQFTVCMDQDGLHRILITPEATEKTSPVGL